MTLGKMAAPGSRSDPEPTRFGIYLEQELPHETPRPARVGPAQGQAAFLARLEREVPDPELTSQIDPVTHPLGCKRVLQSNDWYPALQRENVELVDSPVKQEIGHSRLRNAGPGIPPSRRSYLRHRFYADPLPHASEDHGASDRLNHVWKNGAEAYLGVTRRGFSNFFMMYGPNTNIGSIVYMLESCVGI